MNDRELLELAAKAAGIRHIQPTNDYDGSLGLILCDKYNWPGRDWNPLTDDGDALRLAVKLGMRVATRNGGACPMTEVVIGYGLLATTSGKAEPHGDDAMAATRRAIVRAAAEIGKAMP